MAVGFYHTLLMVKEVNTYYWTWRKTYRREVVFFDKNFQFLSKKNNFSPKKPFHTPFERSEKQCVVRHVQ